MSYVKATNKILEILDKGGWQDLSLQEIDNTLKLIKDDLRQGNKPTLFNRFSHEELEGISGGNGRMAEALSIVSGRSVRASTQVEYSGLQQEVMVMLKESLCKWIVVIYIKSIKRYCLVMKKLILILLCLLPFAFTQGQTFEVKVVKVVDGDTFDGMNSDGLVLRFRINGIDTPERGQAYCNVATNYLKSLIAGKNIKVSVKEKDRYGRFIATPYTPQGEDVSLLMIQEGMAWHYSKYDQTEVYALAEKSAREKRKGLWADPNPINPEQYRRNNK